MLNSARKVEVSDPVCSQGNLALTRRMSSAPALCIEKLVAGGKGLARWGAQVVVVAGSLPGESVLVDISSKHRGVLQGRVLDVLQPSVERVPPPCPMFGPCGGCQFQHQTYEGQLAQKHLILEEAFSRIGKLSVPHIPELVPSPRSYGYRTSVRFVICQQENRFQLGFYKQGTRTAIHAADCLLVPDHVRGLMGNISEYLARQQRLPLVMHDLEIRWSDFSGTGLLVFRGRYDRVSHARAFLQTFDHLPSLAGMIVVASKAGASRRSNPSCVVQGQNHLIDRFDSLTLRVGFRSFVQANWAVYEAIGRTLVEWIGEGHGQRILELYAGVGALGLTLARKGALVTLVEANTFAVTDARRSAALNHVGRCRFRAETVESFLSHTGVGDYEVVLVDPPRTGLSRLAAQELGRVRSPRLFYISCDPATLARDLSRLCTHGYRIQRVQPFDMFPQTAHIETLVELVL